MRELQHPNIVNLKDILMQVFLRRTFSPFNHQSQESKLYLIFEFLTMDLKQYMDTQCGSKDQPMQPQLVKSWIYQLCQVGLRMACTCTA